MVDLFAASFSVFWWTCSAGISAGIRVDRRSVSEAWPNSTDEADDRAYKLLMELGHDPALIALMQRYHLKTGSLKELGPNDAQYVYEIKKTASGIESRIEEGYNHIMLVGDWGGRISDYIALRIRAPPGDTVFRCPKVLPTLLHELAHCRFDGSADATKHMLGDTSDPAEKQFRDFLHQLEKEYRELQRDLKKGKLASPQQCRDVRSRTSAATSAVASATSSVSSAVSVAMSHQYLTVARFAIAVLVIASLRKMLRWRAGNFVKHQHVRTRGLRSDHRNGIEGTLTYYDAWRGVWCLRRHNGATQMVRAANLEQIG